MGERLGIEDPEQWLEDCPDRVFDRWSAAYRLSPFGDEQLLLAKICSLLFLLATEKYKDNTYDAMESLTKVFMPADWIGNAREKQKIKLDVEAMKRFQEVAAKLF